MFVRAYSKSEIDVRDEWEINGNQAVLKNGIADDGISIGTPIEEFTAQGDDVTGDFEGTGGSLLFVTDHFENALVLGTNYASGLTPSNVVGWTGNLSVITDGIETQSNALGHETNATTSSFDLDLGAGNEQAINTLEYVYYYDTNDRRPESFDVEGSNDGVGFTPITNVPISHPNAVGTYTFPFTNSVAYRHYRFKVNNVGVAFLMPEFKIYVAAFASSSNTTKAVIPATGQKSYAPDSLKITDENDVEVLGAGKVNVAFEIAGNGFSTLEDMEDFKTRDPSEFTNASQLKIEIQPVGSQKFKTVSISTVNASFQLTKQGDYISRVAGKVVSQMLAGALSAKSVKFGEDVTVVSAEESNGTSISGSTQFDPASAGTNLETDFPIRNTILTGPNEALGKTVIEGHPSINNGDVSEQGQVGNGSPFTHRIDLGFNTQLNLARYYTRGSNYNGAYQNPHTVNFYRSDDDVSYTLVVSHTSLPDPANAQRIIDLDISSFNARYIRWDSFSNAGQIHTEMELYLTSPTTNFNTIETNFSIFATAIDIATATFKAYDENGVLITGVNKVNVAFKNISGGDSNFSPLEDQNNITKSDLLGTTEFQIQVQPIGLIQISKVTVETIAGEILGNANGSMLFKQAGVTFGEISKDNATLPGYGDKNNLWDAVAGISYGSSNLFRDDPDISTIVSDPSTPHGGNPPDNAFDGLTDVGNRVQWGATTNIWVGRLFTNDKVMGQFIVHNFAQSNNQCANDVRVEGYLGGDVQENNNWEKIDITDAINATVNNGNAESLTAQAIVTLTTINVKAYAGYRLFIIGNQGNGVETQITELEGFETIDSSSTINTVSSVNKVHSIVRDFGEWQEDPNDLGKSLYDYEDKAIVKFNDKLYINVSGTTLAKGESDPSVDTTNWRPFAINIIGTALDTTSLESNFPAASHEGLWAAVQGATSKDADGLYQSNGTVWVKKLDDSDFKIGDRTTLWNFASGISYGGTDDLFTTAGTARLRNNADTADVPDSSGPVANLFDGVETNNSSFVRVTSANLPALAYKEFSSGSLVLGRFDFFRTGHSASAGNDLVQSFQIIGKDLSDNIVTISPVSVTGAASIQNTTEIHFDSATQSGISITVDTLNVTNYKAYGIRILTGGPHSVAAMGEMSGSPTIDISSTINCVDSINRIRNQVIGFENWVEDPGNLTNSLYDYEENAIVKFLDKQYINISGGTIAKGSSNPTVDTANWRQLGFDLIGSATDISTLNTNFPPASYANQWAIVQGVSPQDEDGLYQSDGANWIKRLDDSDFKIGDRTQLFNFATGQIIGTVDQLLTATLTATTGSGSGPGNWDPVNPPSLIADGNGSTTGVVWSPSTAFGEAKISFTGSLSLGKWTIKCPATRVAKEIKILGSNNGGAIKTALKTTSILDNGASIDSNGLITLADNPNVTTIQFTDFANYAEYYFQVHDTHRVGTDNTHIETLEAFTITDLSSTVNCVNSINKLHEDLAHKVETLSANATLDEANGTIFADATSGNLVFTLPPAANVPEKVYIVLKKDSSANTVTLDGDAAETINGQASEVLASQYDFAIIKSDGAEWFKINGGAGGGGSGETNTVSNVGGGLGAFKQKVGVNFEFNTFVAGIGTEAVLDSDTIKINQKFGIHTDNTHYTVPADGSVQYIFINVPGASDIDVTLPDGNTFGSGRIIMVKKKGAGSGNVNLVASGSDTIFDTSSVTSLPIAFTGESKIVAWDGSEYNTVY